MKEFFRQHGLRILAVAAAVAVALSLLTYFSSTSSVLENIAGVLTYPFRAAATAVSDWAADKRQYYEDTTTLKEENAALKKEIADLRAQQRQAQADSEENKLLRELLKLQQQRRDFTFVSTAVLAHSESSWTSSLSLNHGTDQDIAVGDCVVSAEGYLVGVISEVGLNWSTVLTVIDTDTELGARIFRTGEVAVAEGDFALMGQGKLKSLVPHVGRRGAHRRPDRHVGPWRILPERPCHRLGRIAPDRRRRPCPLRGPHAHDGL